MSLPRGGTLPPGAELVDGHASPLRDEGAERFGSEPKTEFWYVARADPGAELYVGLRNKISAADFRRAIDAGEAADHLHAIRVKAGDGMFLPSGRFHAIGGGNLLVEVQQNSDTTYRVFDWNRLDLNGKPRQLHMEESLAAIDFDDYEPGFGQAEGERLVHCQHFCVERWRLEAERLAHEPGRFAVFQVAQGEVRCAGRVFSPGDLFLVPAIADVTVAPLRGPAVLLRTVTG